MKSRFLIALALSALSFSAFAHVGEAHDHGGFLTGFVHPITGLDHLAAMLAVGVWSAMTTRRLWIAPLSFAALLLGGALLAQSGIAFPAIEPMIAASMLVVGLLLAAQVKLPEAAGAVLVGAFALFHGAAHGQELADGSALAGMVAGTALLHTAGIAIGLGFRRANQWLPRLAGAAVALMGLNMGWSLIAG
ncbi:HupE/UreJ family protein [Hydrogenophaga laconesensis]|uniref:Urease accessory protein n=1 Tax=Hydrogenophaga laconesensis TaxID=1805971 RepID=A0ABU1VBM0_9BURK|nr:HupE/UreJ family protein [Hydrogenophaga laconesensis]MDR7094876.1 urease accessory protein [Hydrogenophaga laconesensis]